MFPDKVKLTEDYIDLIVKKRKEHNLTAYQLSEQLGKNKSWLPNIENQRTKNISKSDLLLIFDDFAKEECLETELYIIKYLHPNTLIELDNGEFIQCHFLQTKFELLSLNSSPSEILNNYDFYFKELPTIDDVQELKGDFANVTKIVMDEFKTMTHEQRDSVYKTLDVMEMNLVADLDTMQMLYGINLFKEIHPIFDWNEKRYSEFLEELRSIIFDFSKDVLLLNRKTEVYSYFTPDVRQLTLNKRMAKCYENPLYDEMVIILDDIECYLNAVYKYVELYFELCSTRPFVKPVDFHKIYSIADKFFNGLVNIASLDYKVVFTIPNNDDTPDIIRASHLAANNIYFQIKQLFNEKYKK